MTITEMLGQSGILTLLGMGVVFTFLIILIICMTLVKKLITGLGLDKETVSDTAAGAVAVQSDNNAVIAAIAAAVKEKQSV